ncbi:MAG: hypothetical protein JW716_00425 [Candidatus Aenigmarchaeota archaeon]|nr:hypothetical protein [Candidatus Aenigmarchaeota archaeon]
MEQQFIDYIKDRFGFTKEDFGGLVFIADEKRVYVTTEEVALEENLPGKTHSYGIVAGRIQRDGRTIKPTTNFLQVFGSRAKKNVFDVNDEEKELFIRGTCIETDSELEKGYVIVRWRNHILGCGFLKDGILQSQIPQSRIMKV